MATAVDLAKVGTLTSSQLSGASVLVEVGGDIKRVPIAQLKAALGI